MTNRVLKECKRHGFVEFALCANGRYTCLMCRRNRFIEARRRQKQKLVSLFGGRCEICGYDRCQQALQFHHIEPNKKQFGISSLYRAWKKVLEEVKKCILVCGNCHVEIENNVIVVPQFLLERLLKESSKPEINKIVKNCFICNKEFSILEGEDKNYCSKECFDISRRKVKHPTKEELEIMLWNKPTVKIAEEFGVSDKAIEKWAKQYNLKKPPRGYWTNKGRLV